MASRKTKRQAPRIPAKPLPISADEAARKFEVPRAAIEIAQKLGELPRAPCFTLA
jgi:hypothetical protein